MESAILAKAVDILNLTANQITPLSSMLVKQHVDWLELFMDLFKQSQDSWSFLEHTHRTDS